MIFKEKILEISEIDSPRARQLADELGVSSLVTGVLLSRGFADAAAMREFLFGKEKPFYDPFLLKDMDLACDRIERALAHNEKITVYGDYDVDGITASSLLIQYLRSRSANVESYIPQRKNEGYGLNSAALENIAAGGTTLLITVDCGISNHAEIAGCPKSMDVIVTDHHTVPETVPTAVAVINPHRPDCTYPFKELCGVGVVFKLCQALAQRQGSEWLDYLEFVALGTVADIVPLLDENREIVRRGLKNFVNTKSVGLRALVNKSLPDNSKVNADRIAFILAPRLNAVGRLGNASLAVELLTTENEERAAELAVLLDSENLERQQISTGILEEAEQLLAQEEHVDTAIILKSPNWHQGVIGIVASRLVERYHLPVILFSEDGEFCKGSCRSIAPLNIYDALCAVAGDIEKFGGHRQAAGLSIRTENFAAFKQHFKEYVAKTLRPEEFRHVQHVDVELKDKYITIRDVEQMSLLEPYGCDNPAPIFAYKDIKIRNYRYMGAQKNHLSFDVAKGESLYRGVVWHQPEFAKVLDTQGTVADIAFQPFVNEWNNNVSVQLNVLTMVPKLAVFDFRHGEKDKLKVLGELVHGESNLEVLVNGDKDVCRDVFARHLGNNLQYLSIRNYNELDFVGGTTVVLYDLPQVQVRELIRNLPAQVKRMIILYNNEDYKLFFASHPDLNSMRSIYLFYRGIFDKNGSFNYKSLISENSNLHIAGLQVLQELGLVELDGDMVKDMKFVKVDIASSPLFLSLNETRQKYSKICSENLRISRYDLLRMD